MKNLKTLNEFINEKFDWKNPFGKNLGQFYKYLLDKGAKRDVELELKNGQKVWLDMNWFYQAGEDENVKFHQLHKLKGTKLEVSEKGGHLSPKLMIDISDIFRILYI